jgi:sRNA-binding carbon storage regulator CsrA
MTVIRRKDGPTNGNLVLRVKHEGEIILDGNISIKIFIESSSTAKVVVNAPQHIKVRRTAYEERRDKVQRETTEEA